MKTVKKEKLSNLKKLKIALVSSFTFNQMEKVFKAGCLDIGINAELYFGAYGQHFQEMINPDSNLYQFNPDVIFVSIDLQDLYGDDFISYFSLKDAALKKKNDEILSTIESAISSLLKNSQATIIVHNFNIPDYRPLGILENKQDFGFIESIANLNSRLRDLYKSSDRIFVFDYDNFVSKIGKRELIDPKMYYLADMRINIQHLKELANEYKAYLIPLTSKTKKCIILDLDGTLWGGVIGEDGVEGIKLGPTTPEGRSYLEFQKHLLNLFNQGIILAINSKNNPEEITVFKQHPHMILKEDNFASIKMNWNDKVANMKAIVEELNIGLDSCVFIDNDQANREMIKYFLPVVKTVDLPEDPSLYSETLKSLKDFNVLQITSEDRARGKMYTAEKKRKQMQGSTKNIDTFLDSLNIKSTINKADAAVIPRISQLTQKTNQFNLTTKRYLENDIKEFISDPQYLVKYVQVKDKFGDYGITAVYIVQKESDEWIIDTLLLSCRIIGKKIEFDIMSDIIKEAKKNKIERIVGHFIPTQKNKPAEFFFKNCKFVSTNRSSDIETWEFNLAKNNF